MVDQLLKTMLAGGHALLEGVPGLGKTLLVRTISRTFNLVFSRIQFTPDLMPTDIIGTNMIFEDDRGHKGFEFAKGPVFANVILADEINRATPKTQSALLEAMQEHSVTAAGQTFKLDEPFFVLATQNPIEMEGTYPLPEAQVDRFMSKIFIGYPNQQEMLKILDETTEKFDDSISQIVDGRAPGRDARAGAGRPGGHPRQGERRARRARHPPGRQGRPGCRQEVRPLRGQPPRRAGADFGLEGRRLGPRADERGPSRTWSGTCCRPCATGSSSTSRARPRGSSATDVLTQVFAAVKA